MPAFWRRNALHVAEVVMEQADDLLTLKVVHADFPGIAARFHGRAENWIRRYANDAELASDPVTVPGWMLWWSVRVPFESPFVGADLDASLALVFCSRVREVLFHPVLHDPINQDIGNWLIERKSEIAFLSRIGRDRFL
jgi:hypothetical protein